jgi:hypothetical protein
MLAWGATIPTEIRCVRFSVPSISELIQSEVHSIALVFVSVSDRVGSGFIKDPARPGRAETSPGLAISKIPGGGNGWRSCGRLHRRSNVLDITYHSPCCSFRGSVASVGR